MTATFNYRVRDRAGKIVEGHLEGDDEALVEEARARGLDRDRVRGRGVARDGRAGEPV